MSTPAGDDLVGDATIRVDGDTDPATRALARFSRDANGRLRDLRGRFVSESALINRSLVSAAGGGDRFNLSLSSLGSAARAAGGVLASVGARVGTLAAGVGAAVPVAAGLAAALANIAPAAGLAATGIIAVGAAGAALKIGMIGLEDAFAAAFDPSKAEEFNTALAKLSPNAQSFVLAVRGMKPAFDQLRLDVQDALFAKLGTTLERTASTLLPQVSAALRTSAGTLNLMAQNTLNTATGLSESGALGKALGGAIRGFRALSDLPGLVVQGLVQVGAAAAPSFEQLSKAAGGALDRVRDRLTTAFETGAMQRAIETAIGLIGQLAQVAGNIGSIIGSVFQAAQVSGGGFIGTLQTITGQLAKTFQSPAVQSALQSLFQTMGTLATTAAPLLGSALGAIAPVLTALGPPVQTLIRALGAALAPVIDALGPVLVVAAQAVGSLVTALAPLLPVIGNLVASLLPPLIPAIQAITRAWTQAAPIVAQLGRILASVLAPIIAQLPTILAPLISTFTTLTSTILPVVSRLLVALTPSLVTLGQAFGQILVAVAPLLAVLGQLVGQALAALVPILTPIIALVGRLASIFANELALRIQTIVVPAIQVITSLLKGDFSGAFEAAKKVVSGVVGAIVRFFTTLPAKVFSAVAPLASKLRQRAVEAGTTLLNAIGDKIGSAVTTLRGLPGRAFSALGALAGRLRERASAAGAALLRALRDKIGDAVEAVRGMPGRARSALGDLSGRLVGAGRDLIRGMIGGIRDMAGSLVSAAKDVVGSAVDGAKSLLGISSPSKVFREIGRDTGRGFIIGLTGTREQINRTATGIASSITSAFRGRNTRVDDRLVSLVQSGNRRLQGLAAERDQIAQRIADAQNFAGDVAQRASGAFSLSSLAGETTSEVGLEAGLRRGSKAIQDFARNIRTLQAKGLSQGLLRQFLELGPEQGGALARSVAAQGQAYIRRINALQGSITRSSAGLGRLGADALFDSGRQAGRGFLTGLKAQQKQIEQLMLSIAKGMQRAIRRALGIKSPSTVMAEVGRLSTLGLAEGLVDRLPAVRQAVGALSDSIAGTTGRLGAPALAGAGALPVGSMRTAAVGAPVTNIINLNLSNHGVLGSQLEVRNWLIRELDTLRRLNKLPSTQRGG